MRSLSLVATAAASALALSIAAPSPAFAQSSRYDEAVSKAAMKWEVAYLGLSAIDAVQTIYCLERNECTEANPLFGKRPSTETVILAKLIGSGVQFALFDAVRRKNPKMALRVAQVSFALQGTVVALNMRVVF